MNNKLVALVLASGLVAPLAWAAGGQPWHNIGRDATPDEVAAWDIDVRPDFKGLPAGSGTVARGADIWEAQCALCHGVFGESNEVFAPIVGGTTAKDIATGRVANLLPAKQWPQRSTMMKLSTVSTLWDYINRAMPWNAPKSLSVDEVYAVTAYILNLADVVPEDFTLSNQNMADVQKRLPNRNGMVAYEPLWDVNGKGDVQTVACMKDCVKEVKLVSVLPEHARDAHGNLAKQNRLIGPVRGADTTKPPPATLMVASAAATQVTMPSKKASADIKVLLSSQSCTACHGMKQKLVGPGFSQIADKYQGRSDAVAYLSAKIKAGGSGVWGAVPMPAQTQLSDADAKAMAEWIAAGAR